MIENLRNRFADYGVVPPVSAWEGIAAELGDQQEHKVLRDKISATEISPPESSWVYLASVLNSNDQGKLVNDSSFFKAKTYGKVAALMAGVVLLGSIYLLVNNHTKRSSRLDSEFAAANKSEKKSSPEVVKPSQGPLVAQATPTSPLATSLYSSLKSKKKIFSTSKRYLYKSIIRERENLELPLVSIAAKPIRNENGDIIQDSGLLSKSDNKYVSITSPNGQQTKISAKFVNLLLYLNGDNDSDQNEGVFHKSFLESLLWKSRFQSWRNTISQTAFIPSSTNFLDILEMKDLILQQQDVN